MKNKSLYGSVISSTELGVGIPYDPLVWYCSGCGWVMQRELGNCYCHCGDQKKWELSREGAAYLKKAARFARETSKQRRN